MAYYRYISLTQEAAASLRYTLTADYPKITVSPNLPPPVRSNQYHPHHRRLVFHTPPVTHRDGYTIYRIESPTPMPGWGNTDHPPDTRGPARLMKIKARYLIFSGYLPETVEIDDEVFLQRDDRVWCGSRSRLLLRSYSRNSPGDPLVYTEPLLRPHRATPSTAWFIHGDHLFTRRGKEFISATAPALSKPPAALVWSCDPSPPPVIDGRTRQRWSSTLTDFLYNGQLFIRGEPTVTEHCRRLPSGETQYFTKETPAHLWRSPHNRVKSLVGRYVYY